MDQYIYIYISIWSIPLGSDVQQKHRFFSHSSHAASYIYRSSSDASSCFCWTSIYIAGSWFHITCGSLIYYCYHQNQKGCLSPQGSLNCKDLAIRLNWHDLANFLCPQIKELTMLDGQRPQILMSNELSRTPLIWDLLAQAWVKHGETNM